MNVNLPPPALAINTWVQSASDQLKSIDIASARLDAELILAHTLRKDRTYLHAHSDDVLDIKVQDEADAQLALRIKHMPVAYLVGHKEFYGRNFTVTSDTLIPRPESETIIDILKGLVPANTQWRLVDVGTGSGCLGITAKLEIPELDVTLLDISSPALEIASINARQLHADVTIAESNLLQNYSLQANIIIANLPYVDRSWKRSPDTDHEPGIALFADNDGLELIYKLIDQSPSSLNHNGFLILEADPVQHQAIVEYAGEKDFQLISKQDYCVTLKRL
ncbi:peptide chain release factor N(5)-glutamine methyltransferase [Candidatus Saccharibacteria bacterium]|nr:peptide chain release factor N(5)-glutamine methyltransferase [Candidatus Saccharibacteria bacterium]